MSKHSIQLEPDLGVGLCIVVLIPIIPAMVTGHLVGLDERIGDGPTHYGCIGMQRMNGLGLNLWGDRHFCIQKVSIYGGIVCVMDAFSCAICLVAGWGKHYTWFVAAIVLFNFWSINNGQRFGPVE